MTDKNTPVCAPMTTFTPDPTPIKRGPDTLAASLEKARPAIVDAVRKDLAAQYPIPPLREQRVEGRITTTGTETELRERWAKLMKAESVLQEQRNAIEAVLEKGADYQGTNDIIDAVRDVLADQNTRPSPDFRRLMVNAHDKLARMKEIVDKAESVDAMPLLKEAMRLTDVERLQPWPGSAQGRAMVFVVNDLIDELRDIADGDHADIVDDQVWIEQTRLDLEEARDKPEEYLARMAVQRRARS